MVISKHKEGGAYRVLIDGRATALMISQGPVSRYREPPEWNVYVDDDGHHLFAAHSLQGCVTRLERLATIFSGATA